jgi:citrate lyase beta subunit
MQRYERFIDGVFLVVRVNGRRVDEPRIERARGLLQGVA